ncbi:Detected protein of confused Function [Hibiscus syriacus]|uniref:Detected protein of confused Function n=1 Tax=Hibiscus syriacus TaxID=106335 RepID=A0A6A2XTG3_HIBSY|nr:Detected protein of confused Function [Hibiscus syriacus]
MSSMGVEEQLVPVIQRLIASLEQVSNSGNYWKTEIPSSPSNANAQLEAPSSTKAPLLGKPSKQEKKNKDHVIAVRDIELEEHRKSTDRGVKTDPAALDSNNQNGASSSNILQKDLDSTRIRPGSQNIRKKWAYHAPVNDYNSILTFEVSVYRQEIRLRFRAGTKFEAMALAVYNLCIVS